MKKSILCAGSALRAVALLGAGTTAAFIAAVPVAAQDISSGQITGVVQDQAGNAVPGATVTLTSTERALTRTVTTGASGGFSFTGLPLGNYDIAVTSAAGNARVTEAQAILGGAAYTVQVGAVTAEGGEIVVTGRRARSLDFSQTATGAVFDVQEVAERLPVPRTLESVALLAPQVVSGDQSFGADYPNGTISLGGSSIAENIYYINGLNVTNFRTFIGGSTVPFEFYDQVQVKTGGYQAEFGRSTGGALIAVSRSGSNEWRGGMNAYWSPGGLRATSPDTYAVNNSNDRVVQAEGNVWVSGPVIKDRVYAFAFFNPRYSSSYGENLTGTTRATLKSKTPFYGGRVDVDLFDGHRLDFTYFNDSNRDITEQDADTPDGTTRRTYEYDFTGGENYIARYTGRFTDWMTLTAMYGRSDYERRTTGTDASAPYTLLVAPTGPGTPAQFIQGIGALLDNGSDRRQQWRADVDIFANFFGEHHFRFGADYEKLNTVNVAGYSGGEINYFYTNWNSTTTSFGIAPGEEYLRRIVYLSQGEFENQNTAFYIQDNWDVTDRLQLSLGLRNDRFRNLGINDVEFVDIKNQWAPRLGVTYDVTGDRRTRLSAFYGRYFLPIAANTNLRMAGEEQYFEDIYRYTGTPTNYEIVGPSLRPIVYSNVTDPDPTTLVSKNLEPQYMDEFIVGLERRFGERWRFGVNVTRRNLKSVLEDADLNQYAVAAFCGENPEACGGETDLAVGAGGYVLLNPGKDAIINVLPQGGFAGGELTIPAEYIDLPKGKRKYTAVEFSFNRDWDGKWLAGGSYTWSKLKGNYEGGVKSDNGQDDVGLTQDFDEPGWMDGAYGYLPNDRRHQFKLWGSYAVTDALTLGANARLMSGRPFGCMGIYPFDDDRAITSAYDSWYCGDRSQAVDTDGDGEVDQAPPILAGRGNAFRGAWEKRLDLNVAYRLPLRGLSSVILRADVFNVLNADSPVDYNEYGDEDTSLLANGNAPLNVNYRKPTLYQTPRYVRFGVSVEF